MEKPTTPYDLLLQFTHCTSLSHNIYINNKCNMQVCYQHFTQLYQSKCRFNQPFYVNVDWGKRKFLKLQVIHLLAFIVVRLDPCVSVERMPDYKFSASHCESLSTRSEPFLHFTDRFYCFHEFLLKRNVLLFYFPNLEAILVWLRQGVHLLLHYIFSEKVIAVSIKSKANLLCLICQGST